MLQQHTGNTATATVAVLSQNFQNNSESGILLLNLGPNYARVCM